MISKKAQSEIITTVLIILLVLAAIVIVWQVVQGTLNKTKKQIENKDACIGIQLEIASARVYSTGPETVTVTRKPGADDVILSDVTILVDGVTDNAAVQQLPATDETMAVYTTKTWNLTVSPAANAKVQVAAKIGTLNCDPSAESTFSAYA